VVNRLVQLQDSMRVVGALKCQRFALGKLPVLIDRGLRVG
jgi:hypothetical protein